MFRAPVPACDAIDHRLRIGGGSVATPGDMVIRTNQQQPSAIQSMRLLAWHIQQAQRHTARLCSGLQRGARAGGRGGRGGFDSEANGRRLSSFFASEEGLELEGTGFGLEVY